MTFGVVSEHFILSPALINAFFIASKFIEKSLGYWGKHNFTASSKVFFVSIAMQQTEQDLGFVILIASNIAGLAECSARYMVTLGEFGVECAKLVLERHGIISSDFGVWIAG